MKKFKEIFQNKNYARLFFANFTSQMGSTIGLTAFMFYLLDRFSDQPVYASITELMYSLPTLAVFFLVGVFADRMDRQKIAYYCDWITAALSVALIGTILIGWMPLIFFVLFLRSAVQKFFFPAEHAMVQGILKEDDYTAAAGLNQLIMSLFMLFGNGLGILAYWTVGVYGAILVDAVTFGLSALLIRSCCIAEEVRLPNGKHTLKDLNLKLVFRDFKVGMQYILNNKLLSALLAGFIVFGVVNGGFSVMPVFMLKYRLAPETYEELSVVIGMVFGAGILLGSFIATLLSQKIKLYQMIIAGITITGGFVIAASFAESIILFMVLIFLTSLGLPLVNIAIGGWMPSIIDPKMMGRVQGWISPLMMLSQSVTLGFIAYSFPAILKVEMLYWLVGGCLILVGLFYTAVLPKYSRTEEELEKAAAETAI
ncbi:MFS transporter [Bacillus infantis]|uniref:MFS transporter n=1 Tax=Bacillus infantis TaxID=324767 RepID=UPI00101D0888|nr:MFS transporter [Bacillus infantis]MCP1157464.1 MFS transporter [Bacillus infantis]RYI27258.1 MFS transporter [Bacillus infantis]